MRVLVVDQDSALLTEITQTLGDYFTIDAVTNKADCLDLARVNEFDVIVAGERLEDGSGLELLGQMERSRPDMLRIFAADRERLKLLKGRLGPFRLFRTLSYPIELRQLLAALSAAAGIEDEIEEDAQPEAPEQPAPESPELVSVAVTAVRRSSNTVPEPAPMRPANSRPEGRSRGVSRTSRPTSARVSRQPTPAALALGSRLAAASKPKGFPPPLREPSAGRSAFLVGAGIVVVVGFLVLAFRVSNTSDEPTVRTTLSDRAPVRFPPEVVKLVTDTDAALQHQELKTARTNIVALQQIAPTHPRLSLFEALLQKEEAAAAAISRSSLSSSAARTLPRHVSPRKITSTTDADTEPASSNSNPPRRIPGASTFGGKTVEEGSSNSADQPPHAPVSQTMVARVSASAATPSVTDVRLIERTPPEYPEEAARHGIEGEVDLSFLVSARGEVHDVAVLHAEPSSIFNRAAIAAVHRWKYQPKTVNGVPVEAHVQLRLTFKLDHRE
jgi:protein TonB